MPALRRAEAPLRIGVLGLADIVKRRFLPGLEGCSRARLTALASRDPERARTLALAYRGTPMTYPELIRSDQVDLVYLPLPNHLHEEWVLACLAAGKHVLCEKPLGLAPESVLRMVEAARRHRLLLMENIMYLRHPQHARVREIVASGRIGSVTGLNCVFTIPQPSPGNFRLQKGCGGGAFHDLNRYPLSAARALLCGAVEEIGPCRAEFREGMIWSLSAEARTSAGEEFRFWIAFGESYRCYYELSGTEGELRLERAFTPPPGFCCELSIREGRKEERLSMPAADQFGLNVEEAARVIETGPFEPQYEQCLALARLAERFRQQAEGER